MPRTSIAVLIVMFIAGCGDADAPARVHFFEGTWEEALTRAREEHKLVYVDMVTPWCGPCKEMDRDTYTDSDVASFMHDHFIPLKRDAEEGEGQLLAMQLRIRAYPTHLIFDSDGTLLYRVTNGMAPEPFLDAMRTGLDPDQQLSGQRHKVHVDDDYPDFLLSGCPGQRPPPDSVVWAYLDSHEDWLAPTAWTVLYWYGRGEKVWKFVQQNSDELERRYGGEDVQGKQEMLLEGMFRAAVLRKDAAMFDTMLTRLERVIGDRMFFLREWSYRYRFATETQDWDQLVRLIQEMLDDPKHTCDDGMLNNTAYSLYKGCDDPAHLAWARDLMADVADEDSPWEFIDTYACLLYKTGDLAAAEAQARRALQRAESVGEDAENTRALLARIRSER